MLLKILHKVLFEFLEIEFKLFWAKQKKWPTENEMLPKMIFLIIFKDLIYFLLIIDFL